VTRKTKIRLYKSLVKPVLLYGCKTWKTNQDNARKSDLFQNRCLRRIMKVKWQDKVSSRELLERANMGRLSDDVRREDGDSLGTCLEKNMPDMGPGGE